MTIIYKYLIHPGNQIIELPVGSKIISTGFQFEDLVIWAEVDVNSHDTERYMVCAILTGGQFSDLAKKLEFIGTTESLAGFVCHVYGGLVPK